jgi:predicted GNAT family acetyltransferase
VKTIPFTRAKSADGFREISGVCTHPDFQGRGLAQKLTKKLISIALKRGERPFLHVKLDNVGAHRLYEKMGFVHHQVVAFQIVSKT